MHNDSLPQAQREIEESEPFTPPRRAIPNPTQEKGSQFPKILLEEALDKARYRLDRLQPFVDEAQEVEQLINDLEKLRPKYDVQAKRQVAREQNIAAKNTNPKSVPRKRSGKTRREIIQFLREAGPEGAKLKDLIASLELTGSAAAYHFRILGDDVVRLGRGRYALSEFVETNGDRPPEPEPEPTDSDFKASMFGA